MSRVIEVVDYDPVWIAAFEKEAAILNAIFGQRVIEVHHIGSTAVPGLDAKTIIDILVVLDHTDDINTFDRRWRCWLPCARRVLKRSDPRYARTVLFH